MSKKFNHRVEVHGVTFDVTGEYDAEVPSSWNDPGCGSIVDIGFIGVDGSKQNLHHVLCPKTISSIEKSIDRIEA